MDANQALAEGYDTKHRAIEIVGISLFFACEALLLRNLFLAWDGQIAMIVVAGIVGYLCADLLSGMVHWAGDTWGSPDVPVFGRNFIRPFRHHHHDPKAITHHDFVATNGNNCMTTLVGLLPAAFIRVAPDHHVRSFILWTVAFIAAGVFLTNQIHKWAHQAEPPRVIALLQRWRIVLSPDHHQLHHDRPYASNYCITTGWMNPVLDRLGIFRRLEWLITAVTGASPRRDEQLKGI